VTPAVNPPPYSSKDIILKTVFFKHMDGRNFTVHDIPITWRFGQLRAKLAQEKAMNLDDFRFLWGAKQLEDGISCLILTHYCQF
jgi:hypothetical protein